MTSDNEVQNAAKYPVRLNSTYIDKLREEMRIDPESHGFSGMFAHNSAPLIVKSNS